MDCPYYNEHGDYRCSLTGEKTLDTLKHDYYCFNGKCGYDNCPVYKDYWDKK